jgi:hypothetical protein
MTPIVKAAPLGAALLVLVVLPVPAACVVLAVAPAISRPLEN